jgi:hypothetical protein
MVDSSLSIDDKMMMVQKNSIFQQREEVAGCKLPRVQMIF